MRASLTHAVHRCSSLLTGLHQQKVPEGTSENLVAEANTPSPAPLHPSLIKTFTPPLLLQERTIMSPNNRNMVHIPRKCRNTTSMT